MELCDIKPDTGLACRIQSFVTTGIICSPLETEASGYRGTNNGVTDYFCMKTIFLSCCFCCCFFFCSLTTFLMQYQASTALITYGLEKDDVHILNEHCRFLQVILQVLLHPDMTTIENDFTIGKINAHVSTDSHLSFNSEVRNHRITVLRKYTRHYNHLKIRDGHSEVTSKECFFIEMPNAFQKFNGSLNTCWKSEV